MSPTAPRSADEACDPHSGCITCSDEGVPMRVVSARRGGAAGGLAVCEDEAGSRREVMTGVVGDVSPGEWLLVHAGAALVRLPDHPAEAASAAPTGTAPAALPDPAETAAGVTEATAAPATGEAP